MIVRIVTGWITVLSLAGVATAGSRPIVKRPDVGDVWSMLGGGTTDALAGSLRGYLVRNLAPTLFESSPGWGNTKLAADGLEWKGKGLHVHPEVRHTLKNDGTWRHVKVTADNLADTLVLDLRDPRQPEPGRLTFTAVLAFDARLFYDEEKWRTGVRLYAASARARVRIKLTVQCEATVRLEPGQALLPDAVFRLRVVHSDLHYDNLVVEHLAGLGGEAAKLFGDAFRGGLRQWHPSLERDLLVRANAAVEKAGDTKEVRLSLAKLLKGKI
jgi:hypothetical protein